MNKELIDKVIEQINEDIGIGDISPIEELLQFLSDEALKNYLAYEEIK